MSTMLRIQMRMTVQKYISNICSNNSSSIHQVLCLHSSKSRHSRWSPHLEFPSMEDNSNKQLGGCLQVGVLMLEPHLVTAVKMLSEELVDLHMVWLQRVEIYLGQQLEAQVLAFSLVEHNLEVERAQLNNQVSSNLVLFLNLAALEVVLVPFSVLGQVLLQMILMQILL